MQSQLARIYIKISVDMCLLHSNKLQTVYSNTNNAHQAASEVSTNCNYETWR